MIKNTILVLFLFFWLGVGYIDYDEAHTLKCSNINDDWSYK